MPQIFYAPQSGMAAYCGRFCSYNTIMRCARRKRTRISVIVVCMAVLVMISASLFSFNRCAESIANSAVSGAVYAAAAQAAESAAESYAMAGEAGGLTFSDGAPADMAAANSAAKIAAESFGKRLQSLLPQKLSVPWTAFFGLSGAAGGVSVRLDVRYSVSAEVCRDIQSFGGQHIYTLYILLTADARYFCALTGGGITYCHIIPLAQTTR